MARYMVNAGDMRTRITFQEPTLSKDGSGAQSPGWANVADTPTVWARWINAHGQEAVQSDALKASQRATVTVRHRTDILPSWRIVKGGKYWQILSVDMVQERNRYVEMIVEQTRGTV